MIDSYLDCAQLPWMEEKDPRMKQYRKYNGIDWEELKTVADAVYLTGNGEAETRFVTEHSLYGYDCECVLALKGSAIFPD